MNLYVGGFAPNKRTPPDAPGNTAGISSAGSYSVYSRMTDVNGAMPSPGPVKLWIFLDQREDRINWGNYMTDMRGFYPMAPPIYGFEQDMPGFYHGMAAGFSFADGHSEVHKWRDGRTCPPLQYGVAVDSYVASPWNRDVAWLQDHSTRPRVWKGGY